MNTVIKTVAGRAAGQAARKFIGDGALLDPKRGWAMLRDKTVPAAPKLLAVGMGVVLTAVLAAVEIPLETVIGLFLPVVGMGADLLFDGLEMIIAPVLFATLLLPHLLKAPAALQARGARNVTPKR